MGFSISDSDMLKAEMEKQAYYSYLSGEYVLDRLDPYGQRIDIIVKIMGKNGKSL